MRFASAYLLTVAFLVTAFLDVAASETSCLMSAPATAGEVTRVDSNESTLAIQNLVAQQGPGYSVCIGACPCKTRFDICITASSEDHIKKVCVPQKQKCEVDCKKDCDQRYK